MHRSSRDDRRKVLCVIAAYEPAWHLGGVVRSHSLLCRALSSLGVDVTVYTTDSGISGRLDVPVNEPVDVGGVRVFYFRTDWSLKYCYSRALARACRDSIREYDIMYSVSFWTYPGLVACREARRQAVPYVMMPQGVLTSYSLQQKRIKKWLYLMAAEHRSLRQAAAIRYTAEPERQESAHLRLVTPSFVVPNGIDCREFDDLPAREAAREHLGLPSGMPIVAYLGRLHSCKALDVLVLAFAQVLEKVPDAHLVLAGPDDGREVTLRNLVRELGLDSKVQFTGFMNREKRLDLLSTADLITLVSYHENFGNVVAEAMAAGVPVLVSDRVAIHHEIEADGAARVVPVQKDAIARELTELLLSPTTLRTMGRAAYLSARNRYDIRGVAQRMLVSFEDVLTGRRSPGLGWSDV